MIVKKNVDVRKPYSPRQKFPDVSALTIENKKDLRCKIVAKKIFRMSRSLPQRKFKWNYMASPSK